MDDGAAGCPITVLLYFSDSHLDAALWFWTYGWGIVCGLASGWLGLAIAHWRGR